VNEQGLPIFRRVAFDPSVPADNIAVSHTNELGTKVILIHPDYVGASIELGPTLIHQALHQDSKKNDQPANGQPEEVITNTAETMGWFEYVLIDPGLAHQNTELVTGHNSELFAFLESGAAGFPNPGIKTAPVENARISFENLQRLINGGLEDVTTPGNNLLNAYIHAVTGRPTDPPGNFDFSNETLAYLDSQRLFDAEEALIAANVLKLTKLFNISHLVGVTLLRELACHCFGVFGEAVQDTLTCGFEDAKSGHGTFQGRDGSLSGQGDASLRGWSLGLGQRRKLQLSFRC
jgi:hypothetical protein